MPPCTNLILANVTDQDAADIMGWSPDQVAGIRRVYVDLSRVVAAIGQRITAMLLNAVQNAIHNIEGRPISYAFSITCGCSSMVEQKPSTAQGRTLAVI